MFQFLILKLFILINGLGAASGIVYNKQNIYVVSDDLTYLFQYNLKTQQQSKYAFNTILQADKMTKKNKLDFESLTLAHGNLLALGSGSKENRNELHSFNLKTKEVARYNVSDTYNELKKRFNISNNDFNIEGFIYHKGKTYLFNRGNGKSNLNGVFIFEGLPHYTKLLKTEFVTIQLPRIKNNLTTFSDAIIVNNKIIFTATIETKSTVVKDGEVKESILGTINLKDFKVDNYHVIAESQKIEGITLLKKSSKGYVFLVCEDNDDDSTEANIYKINVSKDFKEIY